MNKEKNKTKKEIKSSSTFFEEVSKIDELVDRIIEKNKIKLDKIHSEKLDVEKFSLKNKKGNTIYYMKKKPNNKNLEKKHHEKQKDTTENNPTEKSNKKKKRIRFGKKNKKPDEEYNTIPPSTEDLAESDEFKEVINEIEDILEDEKSNKNENEPKIIDEKIKEISKIEEPQEKKDTAEDKASELAEKHGFNSNKDTSKDKKEKDWISDVTDDLAGLKKKYDKNLTITGFNSIGEDESKKYIKAEDEGVGASKKKKSLFKKGAPSVGKPDKEEVEPEKLFGKQKLRVDSLSGEDLDEEDIKLLDKKIEESTAASKKKLEEKKAEIKALKLASEHLKEDAKKGVKAEDEGVGASKKKKSLFKKGAPSVGKPGTSKKLENDSETLFINPRFHVDNIPGSEIDKHEAKLLDEKIKESPDSDKKAPTGEKGETKAVKLAKEHLKDEPMPLFDIKPATEKKGKVDIDLPMASPLTEGDADQEHVFFDEGDTSFTGWSPRATEKERKKMTLSPEGRGEISQKDVTTVGDLELPKEVLQAKSVKLTDLGFSENEWEELDFYSLYKPFAFVEILRERETLDKCYFLVEIELTEDEEKLLAFINDTMASLEIDAFELEEKGGNRYLLDRLDQVIEEYNIKVNEESKKKIFYYIGKTSLGLGKIDPLMKDPNIEDISCDGAGVPIFLYHRKYGSLKSNLRFNDEEELSSFVHKLAQKCGKHISIAEPMLDATMPDGSRIQMTLSDEITAKGSTFTIRKFRSDPFSPPDLVEFNTMSSEMIAYMWIAIENGVNTLFAGGTASGKTTALNALSLFIPRESKIVSIEETREINLPHPNWIPGVARSGFGEVIADRVVGEIDMYDLMKAALRQRPEYILVGEIRGREAYVLFQAMATGHATYSTVHADSAQSLIHRMEGKPINIPRIMLQSLDIVCLHVITRVKNIRARRCKQIIEIIDIDPTTKEILTNEVFRWDPVEDKFIYSGKSYILERIRAEKDLTREEMTEEIKNRKSIVEWMNENNIREFRDVAKIVAQYNEAPEDALRQLGKGTKGAKK